MESISKPIEGKIEGWSVNGYEHHEHRQHGNPHLPFTATIDNKCMTISRLEDLLRITSMNLEEQYNDEGEKPPKQTLTSDTHNNNTKMVQKKPFREPTPYLNQRSRFSNQHRRERMEHVLE